MSKLPKRMPTLTQHMSKMEPKHVTNGEKTTLTMNKTLLTKKREKHGTNMINSHLKPYKTSYQK